MADPNTPEEWFALARQHERTARAVVNDKIAAGQARFHAGLGTECALKAYIMRKERLNGWPSKETRPALYTHELRELVMIAGITISPGDQMAPYWKVLLDWDRAQGYDPKPMPRRVARQWVEAAFDPKGLVEWLRRNCL